jgi:[ribosomal protein S5]-alanine N-acetyltransferase
MTAYKTFETERLLLRPTSEADASFLLELLNMPKFLLHIGDRKVRTLEDAERYVQSRINIQLERLGYSSYTVVRKSDGAKIGTCGLYDREGLEGVDIGFAFLPLYEKQGYAHEAAYAVLNAGFNVFHLECIQAITTVYNTDSQKLLEKLGLQYIEMVRIPNDDEELMLYRIDKRQFNSQSLHHG